MRRGTLGSVGSLLKGGAQDRGTSSRLRWPADLQHGLQAGTDRAGRSEILQAERDEIEEKTPPLRRVQVITEQTVAPICRILGSAVRARTGSVLGAPNATPVRRIAWWPRRSAPSSARARRRGRGACPREARVWDGLHPEAHPACEGTQRLEAAAPHAPADGPGAPRPYSAAASNERWCSDVLEIACWNGDGGQLGFAPDCHDREVLATVAALRTRQALDIQRLMHDAVSMRFGLATRPDVPIQWLSDKGSIYTAQDTVITAARISRPPKSCWSRSQPGTPITTPSRRTRRAAISPPHSTGSPVTPWSRPQQKQRL